MQGTGAILSRMKSIRQTVQITNAQKLIAASKISKARRMITDAEPYHSHIQGTIAGMIAAYPEAVPEYLNRAPERTGLFVISSDTGMAGGYATNLTKFTESEIGKQNTVKLLVQGKLGRSHLERAGYVIDNEVDLTLHGVPTLAYARVVAEYVLLLAKNDVIDEFDIIHTYYYSGARQLPVRVQMFPFPLNMHENAREFDPDLKFEPSPGAVIEMLLPQYLSGFIYGTMVHAYTSELAARVTAMDSAMRNGNEMLQKLSLAYNRARQAAITQEITEIVAGAEAINS